MELAMVESWAAEGHSVGVTRDAEGLVTAAALQNRHGRLLIPVRTAPGAQYVAGAATGGLSLVVPGVPETLDAYALTPAGLRSLPHRRATGGVAISDDEFTTATLIAFTSDPQWVGSLTRHGSETARRAAALRIELTRQSLAEVDAVLPQLPDPRRIESRPTDARAPSGSLGGRPDAAAAAGGLLTSARANLAQADRFATSGDAASAHRHAVRAAAALSAVRRMAWEQAAAAIGAPTGNPLAVSFGTLPDFWRLTNSMRHTATGKNLLTAGDCEDLSQMLDAGWRHLRHAQPGIDTQVELSPHSPFSGRACLHVLARATVESARPELVETPPVWIITPKVPVLADSVVRIRGRVRVAVPITGSVDGLLIVDSLGGRPLSLGVGQTTGWQEFSLLRAARRDTSLSVTFVLTGLGEAWIDDVTIQPVLSVQPAPAERR
jgi:hypothetical protein